LQWLCQLILGELLSLQGFRRVHSKPAALLARVVEIQMIVPQVVAGQDRSLPSKT